MADLDPAFIGLGGVLVGSAITQIADSMRWSRERSARLRGRRQVAMIEVLRQGTYVAEFAANMEQGISSAPQSAKLNLDFKPLDEAMHLLRGAVDEITVLGPLQVLSSLGDYAECARKVADCSLAFGTRTEIDAECADLHVARTKLVDAAASAGLVG